ncbi:CBD9-like protein [Delitschia confertaspora ATCC 74209]|uniref:CBD9-like protein n=1 Tax=Delitschia confertaspora ATCC 74209 TaxID=1513339 RepID=A0A9P4MWB5_9PLEO|nr:CBD9-like protein [Delitschia confertaspora ATCC 74209]
MKSFEILSTNVLLLSTALAQWTTVPFYEASTGITYASFTLPNQVSYRIALPEQSNSSDAILQVFAPKTFGWCGLAWGGHMRNNPLSVNWATSASTGPKGITSSRMAFSYSSTPSPNPNATHTLLPLATTSNSTHWTVTSRCQGCTRYSSADGDMIIDAGDSTLFAYACSSTVPTTPNSNTSAFRIHQDTGIWTHDLKMAKSREYGVWLRRNGLETGGGNETKVRIKW